MKNRFFPLFGLMALAACSSNDHHRECPSVNVVRDLAMVQDYGTSAANSLVKPTPDKLRYAVAMKVIESRCHFTPTATQLELDLEFIGVKGKAAAPTANQANAPYFIAILNEAGKITSKQPQTATIRLGTADNPTHSTEPLRAILPNDPAAGNRQLLLGFQLSAEQVAVNRGEVGEPKPLAAPATNVKRATLP
jgi:hypothetical protein